MPKLYITEYEHILAAANGVAPVAVEPRVAEQVITFGASSVQSQAFSERTRCIRVHTDAVCSIDVGENPVATVSKARMAVNQTEYFGVRPGHKIAVIQNT